MIGSRLANRRTNTLATGLSFKTIAGTVVQNQLKATHQQVTVQEQSGPLGEVSTKIIDLFFFDKDKNGDFPAILEKHILTWDSTDYEVLGVKTLNELMGRLRVETERIR